MINYFSLASAASMQTPLRIPPVFLGDQHPIAHATSSIGSHSCVINNEIYATKGNIYSPSTRWSYVSRLDFANEKYVQQRFPTFEHKILYHFGQDEQALAREQPFMISGGLMHRLTIDSNGTLQIDGKRYRAQIMDNERRLARYFEQGILPLAFSTQQGIFEETTQVKLTIPPFWNTLQDTTYAFPQLDILLNYTLHDDSNQPLLSSVKGIPQRHKKNAIIRKPLHLGEGQNHFFRRTDGTICLRLSKLELHSGEVVSAKKIAERLQYCKTIIENGFNKHAVPATYPTEYIVQTRHLGRTNRHFTCNV